MPQDHENLVPYIVHESIVARFERQNKRLIIALIITILLMFATNALWLYEWTRYDYVDDNVTTTETVDIDSGHGIANYIGNNGDISNGEDKSNTDNSEKN